MAFLGATVFFAAVGPCRVMSLEKKSFLKKTLKISSSKKSSPRASDTGKGSYKHNAPDLWDRGSTKLFLVGFGCGMYQLVCTIMFFVKSVFSVPARRLM